jgi:hypothetical protein
MFRVATTSQFIQQNLVKTLISFCGIVMITLDSIPVLTTALVVEEEHCYSTESVHLRLNSSGTSTMVHKSFHMFWQFCLPEHMRQFCLPEHMKPRGSDHSVRKKANQHHHSTKYVPHVRLKTFRSMCGSCGCERLTVKSPPLGSGSWP